MKTSFRRHRLEPVSQRLKRAIRRLRGAFEKRQRVYVVEIGDARIKQVVLPDAWIATEIAANLGRLEALAIFPRVIAQYRNELWLEFLDGTPLDGATTPTSELAEVFAALYGVESHLVPIAEIGARTRIESDLDFLGRARVLSVGSVDALKVVLARCTPTQVWVGYDYSDARAQNFLRTSDGQLRVIDVESIRRDAMIGSGVVRACIRWPELDRSDMAARLAAKGAPSFLEYWEFLEIAFLAAWTKRCVLQRKYGLIDAQRLERLAASR